MITVEKMVINGKEISGWKAYIVAYAVFLVTIVFVLFNFVAFVLGWAHIFGLFIH